MSSFASDNNSGIHPKILEAIKEANIGHEIGYGDDPYTIEAKRLFQKEFGEQTEVFFVLTGTGANILSIQNLTSSFNSIYCAETAHINVDECGAPEKFSGCKIVGIPSTDGKISPELLEKQVHGFDFEHHTQPGLISISQTTELGTVYTVDEVKALADFAHQQGMYLHMDGARISNAAVFLNCRFQEFTKDAGVDILSFGGTKNGMMIGEAVLIFNMELSKKTKYFRKQAAQLFSKMRFISAQFIPYLKEEIWKKNAEHSNRMAQILATQISKTDGIKITQKVQSNGVFVILPKDIIPAIQKEYFFYVWNEDTGEVRFMTSFDTLEEDINRFVSIVNDHLSS